MDSRSSRPTQPDTDQQGSFRVKLRVTHVVVRPYGTLGKPVRSQRDPIELVMRWAKICPSGSDAKALRRLGLEP